MQQKSIIQRAVEVAGGPSKVARRFGFTPAAVGHWIRVDKVPAEHVVDLCHMTHGVFQPHQIRPDIFDAGVRV